MARVPTIAEEDAKRPNRERDCLVGERTRIVNRRKSTLAPRGELNGAHPQCRGEAPHRKAPDMAPEERLGYALGRLGSLLVHWSAHSLGARLADATGSYRIPFYCTAATILVVPCGTGYQLVAIAWPQFRVT